MMDVTQDKFRDNGAIGALLDEYEKSVKELISVLTAISPKDLNVIVDAETADEDCRSIQSILNHVIRAGYNYVIVIRKHLEEALEYKKTENLQTIEAYQSALLEMFAYNEQLFVDYANLSLEEHNPEKKINVTWGQKYDVEQLFEHAIVHVLRHRRQIERFKIRLAKMK